MTGRYTWGKKLGKGGFGNVKVVIEKITGREFACKSISKRLDVPNFSPQKQAAHLDNVRREVVNPVLLVWMISLMKKDWSVSLCSQTSPELIALLRAPIVTSSPLAQLLQSEIIFAALASLM